jgi:hypothetical protein
VSLVEAMFVLIYFAKFCSFIFLIFCKSPLCLTVFFLMYAGAWSLDYSFVGTQLGRIQFRFQLFVLDVGVLPPVAVRIFMFRMSKQSQSSFVLKKGKEIGYNGELLVESQ